jgi:hypothetical protein
VPQHAPGRRVLVVNVLTAIGGIALFAWLIRRVGAGEIWQGFQQIGWGLALIVVLGGLRFACRAAAWARAIDPPHRLRFRDAFTAVVAGDTMGNVITLGPIVSEAAKLAFVRGRVTIAPALTALAIENLFYTLSVAAMIAAGTIALLFAFDLPQALREFSEVALAGVVALLALAVWVLWRRPALVASIPGTLRPGQSSRMHGRLEKLRALEHEIYSFAGRRRDAVLPLIAAEVGFHALGVAEAHVTLWMLTGAPPPLLISFIIEGSNRLLAVAFKFVPFQVGVGEAGTGALTAVLGYGPQPGVTLALARKARMLVWSIAGVALLLGQGLTARRLLQEAEAGRRPTADSLPPN